MTKDEGRIKKYWESFLRYAPEVEAAHTPYQAWAFGNSPQIADQLGDLVVQGDKTATASLVWSYEAEDEPFPQVDDYHIILDGKGIPICIIRTTELVVVPFDEVDEVHAFLEGEGDRSLQYWREVHWAVYKDECLQIGREAQPDMPVLCERFVMVYK